MLEEISETVSLALNRFQKLRLTQEMKKKWEAMFQAVSHPFCLTDKNFRIFEANEAFLKKTNKKLSQALFQDARKIFLGENYPWDESYEKQRSFRMVVEDEKKRIFEVKGERISLDERWFDHIIFVMIFRDLTEQRQLEKKVLKSSKDTELGIISSSMAHELNNPLGAILSFIQLIKMKKPSPENPPLDSQTKKDLDSMEKAALTCRQIVIDLLEFVRKDPKKSSAFLSRLENKSQFDSLRKNKLK